LISLISNLINLFSWQLTQKWAQFIVNSVFSSRKLREMLKRAWWLSSPLGPKETKTICVKRSFNTQKSFYYRFSEKSRTLKINVSIDTNLWLPRICRSSRSWPCSWKCVALDSDTIYGLFQTPVILCIHYLTGYRG